MKHYGELLNEKFSEILQRQYTHLCSDYIYHYTSPYGLKGILTSKKLRFTDRDYLNDYSENAYPFECAIKVIQAMGLDDTNFVNEFVSECARQIEKPGTEHIFQCSFSLDADSLCLWNYYTKGNTINGYNIGFNTIDLVRQIRPTPQKEQGYFTQPFCGEVIYSSDAHAEMIRSVINEYYALFEAINEPLSYPSVVETLVTTIKYIGVVFKQEHFKIESEYKIAFPLRDTGEQIAGVEEQQQFLERNGIFIPYIDIDFPENTIGKITISPTLDAKTARQSILRMTNRDCLFHLRFDGRIIQSSIPVRY